ncbi:G-protein coupled receptor GRL101-like [Mercenaria mercenaria]|uniref:G-protein coupled receptor GRL101-like n=1 Tax=Mercenaria mercenaria TaxID=6596 RepID=UPI00234F54D7|nr:G-protein coupled receptor GRL101-like [Mercenaria mercenaria]
MQNTTFSGKACQNWASKSPHFQHAHDFYFPGESLAGVENYCRDPWDSGYLWCYTMDRESRMEPCVLKDTKEDGLGTVYQRYKGILNHTYTGKPCQLWNKYFTAHKHNRYLDGYMKGNDCRDPLDQGFLWCYISGGGWEPCDADGTSYDLKDSLEYRESMVLSLCNNGKNISILRKCDGRFDCSDYSDETSCWKDIDRNRSCLPDQYQCDGGDCIHISQMCNFVPDCIDQSDENCGSCNTEKAFHCDVVRCIPLRLRCDKYMDCEDGTDEEMCSEKLFMSCDQWWEAGYRNTGSYFVAGMEVICDFDLVVKSGKMYTIVQNRDIIMDFECCDDILLYLLSNIDVGRDDYIVSALVKRPEYFCKQEITQTCLSSHAAAAKFDDPNYIHNYKYCDCVVFEIHINRNIQLEKPCVGHNFKESEGTRLVSPSNQSKLTFSYEETFIYRYMSFLDSQIKYQQYFPGPIVCEHGEFECPKDTVKCSGSYCLPLKFLCDGIAQCPGGQDEENCGCTEEDYEILILYDADYFEDRFNINKFADQFYKDTATIRILSYTTTTKRVLCPNAYKCAWSKNCIPLYQSLPNTLTLDLSYNDIRILSANVFADLIHLRILNLKGNYKLNNIEAGAFNGIGLIRELQLADAKLKTVAAYSFAGLKLDVIDLSNNSIEEIEAFAFSDMSVDTIYFNGNEILNFNKDIFTGVASLRRLKTPAFKFCCIRPNYLNEDQCFPSKDEFSSCEDLMRLSALQTMLWLIGMAALIGNALSIMYRLVYDRKRLKIGYGIFVTNLAVADFFMGVYLIIIAVADAAFRKQ